MRNREAMKINRLALLHNAVRQTIPPSRARRYSSDSPSPVSVPQILFFLSMYMSVETVLASADNFDWGKKPGWSLFCNAVDAKAPRAEVFSPSGLRLAKVLHIHYVSKAYEFLDTVIAIVKKNNRQISFLHVYHHATTFFPVWWAVMAFGLGGEAWFCCFLNSLVHVAMYGYYFFASLGISFTAVKKSITTFQMVQFMCFIGQSVWMLFIKDCYTPRIQPWMLLVQCVIFFGLFGNFYYHNYVVKKRGDKGPKGQ